MGASGLFPVDADDFKQRPSWLQRLQVKALTRRPGFKQQPFWQQRVRVKVLNLFIRLRLREY